MARLIDAVELQANMTEMVASGMYGLEDMIDAVIEAPTLSPDEVRGVGYNKLNEYHTLFQCSVCGWEDDDTTTGSGETNTYNYCPNCGARMKGADGSE